MQISYLSIFIRRIREKTIKIEKNKKTMYEQSVVCVCVLSNNNEKMIVSDILFIRLKRQNIASTTQPASQPAIQPDQTIQLESSLEREKEPAGNRP